MPDPPVTPAPAPTRTIRPGHILVALVDGPDDDHLKCVKVYEWDRTFSIPGSDDPKFPAWLRKLGLARPYKALVDITERPDIVEGETYPFVAKEEA